MDLPSIKYMTQAGGKLSNSIIEEFANHCGNKNIDFFVMYGQTEGTARLSYLNPNKILEKLGSIGKAIPGGEFRLVSNENKIIELPKYAKSTIAKERMVPLTAYRTFKLAYFTPKNVSI